MKHESPIPQVACCNTVNTLPPLPSSPLLYVCLSGRTTLNLFPLQFAVKNRHYPSYASHHNFRRKCLKTNKSIKLLYIFIIWHAEIHSLCFIFSPEDLKFKRIIIYWKLRKQFHKQNSENNCSENHILEPICLLYAFIQLL